MEVGASGEAEQAAAVKAEAQQAAAVKAGAQQATANAQVASKTFESQIDEIIAQYDVLCSSPSPVMNTLTTKLSKKLLFARRARETGPWAIPSARKPALNS